MVEMRVKSHAEQEAGHARREQQRRAYRRNQAFGMILLAVAIVAWWLVHTNRGWVFPAGWWRLW